MWLWALAGALVLLPLLLLAAPVELAFRVERAERTAVRLRLKLLFGLIRPDLAGGEPRPPRPAKPRKRARRSSASGKGALAALKAQGVIGHVTRFLRRLLRAVQFRDLEAHWRVGLGDPADTGQLLGVVYPLLAVAPPAVSRRLSLEPDFQQAVWQGHASGVVSVVPLRILCVCLAFALAPATWRAFRAYRRASRP